jgi:hypothetical protein
MEDIKAKQQKLPIDRVAEKNIYEELKAQYDSAKQTGYGYRHESDLDAIFSRQAGILAAGGLKSVYDIGTRPVERSSVIKAGSSRPDYQVKEDPGLNIQNVRKYGDNYYYDVVDLEGSSDVRQIDPARILDVQEDLVTVPEDEYGNPPRVVSRGLKIQVKDDPRIELINKRTNAAVYDVELNYDKWQEDPLAYKLLDKPMEVDANPYRGFNKINTNYSVRGAADLSFQMVPDAQGNQVPLILPVYRSTSTNLTPLIIATAFLAAGLLGPGATAGAAGSGATAGTAAAGTGATAGTAATGATAGTAAATGATAGTAAGTGFTAGTASTGIGAGAIGTGLTVPAGFTLAPGLGTSLAAGGAGSLLAADAAFAGADAAQLYAQTGNVAAVQQNLIAAGIDPIMAAEAANLAAYGGTGASIGPALASTFPGETVFTSQGLLSGGSTLDPFAKDIAGITSTADSGIGLTDALRAANSVNNLLNRPNIQQQTGLPQSGLLGGGQARGVDFSPLYQNSMVGLLPLAERYRRSLI